MIVCLCEGVPARQVEKAIECGAQSLDQIERACGAGGDCGSCHEYLKRMLAQKPQASRPAGPRRPLVCAPEP